MLDEFSLIQNYFSHRQEPLRLAQKDVSTYRIDLGIGDDCALLASINPGVLAISTDMLVAGRHFFEDVDPKALGHKALAVNLSDLAAMGAQPRAFTLALALPQLDTAWLNAFTEGLFALANQHQCLLIGGDTTRGPLNICPTVFGEVSAKKEEALYRSAARVGDDIWVSGTLGDAALALGAMMGHWNLDAKDLKIVRRALEWPEPRVALGLALRGVAHAAIDISDGLIGDLKHILKASQLSASLYIDRLPRSEIMMKQAREIQLKNLLAGGDDYELCFTAPEHAYQTIVDIGKHADVPLKVIGKIIESPLSTLTTFTSSALIDCYDEQNQLLTHEALSQYQSFDHFKKHV